VVSCLAPDASAPAGSTATQSPPRGVDRRIGPLPSAPWANRIVGHGEVDPSTLVPNPANWRTHPTAQARALEGALGEVGWVVGVIVNRVTGHLVDGHLRVERAVARGEPTVPVAYVELTTDEERLVLATLDPLGALAGADTAMLAELLAGLAPGNDALERMLADLADLYRIARPGLTNPDEIPPLPAGDEVYVRSGELWLLGDHRLLVGDSTIGANAARLIDHEVPVLLATDAPYGVKLDLAGRASASRGSVQRPRSAGHRRTSLQGDERIDWSEAYALVPSLLVGYVWHAAIHAAEVARGLERIGFEIVSQIVWDKGAFVLGRGWYHWAHEPAWVVRRPGVRVPYIGPRDESTVWRAPSPKRSAGVGGDAPQDHPTQKPVVLFEIPIRNHLRAGESVFDPFVGSGTTIIAAERLGRRCLAMEIDPAVAQLAINRWETFSGRKAVRDE
ncbi:MAG: hypothetical protein L3K06_08635, partial [Thermoplasmata archaeon]|nr:hypothetical protein [Thermoplasmata archaeon]